MDTTLTAVAAIGLVCIILSIISLVKSSQLKKQLIALNIDGKFETAEKKITLILNKIAKANPVIAEAMGAKPDTRAITGVGVQKYDAFPGITGSYSFSLALLNDDNNGVIITTLYGHDSCNTYIREVKEGNSDVQLSPEELNALKKAQINSRKDEKHNNEGK